MFTEWTDLFENLQQLKEALHEPKGKYRLYPILHELCDAGFDQKKMLDSLSEDEAGGFVTNTTWTDPQWVFNKDNLDRLSRAVALGRERGQRVWMYDDYYYPSGLANGYAVKDHPEYFAQSIDFLRLAVKAGQTVTIEQDNLLDVALYGPNGVRLHGLTPVNKTVTADADGYILAFFTLTHQDETAKVVGASKGHLDHLSIKAVDAFISNGFAPVDEAVGLSSFDAIFTDEPTLTHQVISFDRGKVDFTCLPLPYTQGLFERYQAEWNEGLIEYLQDLLTGKSLRARLTRIRYYTTLSRMARENYIDRITRYLNDHGTCSSGHFLLEEGLAFHVGYYGDFMRVVGGQDIPGCDILCADGQLFWQKGYGFGTACSLAGKYPSSLARLNGHSLVMLEFCPVMYPEKVKADPFKEFMAIATFAAFTGITHFNSYGYFFISDREQHRMLNRYTGRLLTLLRNARFASGIGIYYPIAAMQGCFACESTDHVPQIDLFCEAGQLESDMEDLCMTLYKAGFDYTVLDSDHLQASKVSKTIACGEICLHTLIVPFSDILPREDTETICAFAQKGGRVIFVNQMPQWDFDGNRISLAHTPYIFCTKEQVSAYLDDRKPIKDLQGLFCSPYEIAGKICYYCINPTEKPITAITDQRLTVYDPEKDLWASVDRCVTVQAERGVFLFEE